MSDRKDDLRRQFGTMWRMASTGLETLREVVVRSSQTGRLRVDLALLGRERQQLLADLGLKVARLVDDGALTVPHGVRVLCDRLRDVEGRIRADSFQAHDNAFGGSRGYEPEAGSFAPDGSDDSNGDIDDSNDDIDEHAELATHSSATATKSARKGETR